ncbi:MAG: histidine kinase [Bacteroidales bacterium]|nr:histidine kinase [Bacteroidales bacterium]MBN2697599.1 histidine kinase [Bacteroidales bacterium]
MSHPFTKKPRVLLFYALVWIVIAALQVLLLHYFQDFPLSIIITESVVSNLIFASLGLLAWYPTRYIPFQPQNPVYSLTAHVVAGMVVIFLWLLTSVGLMTLIFAKFTEYQEFLSGSILWRTVTGIMLYLVLVLVYYLITYAESLRERAQQEERLRLLIRDSELNILKAQINPHFLFNSLNSIASLTMSNPDEAREMIIKLSEFLRYSLKHREHEYVSLEEEVERMKDYLAIEKTRFGEKLRYRFRMDKECRNVKVPTMILQPLFENAIRHGVYESIEPVDIDFQCIPEGEMMKITLQNNYDPEIPPRKGTGVGLQNVKQRMELSYEGRGTVRWKSENALFSVTLYVPGFITDHHEKD